jgi:hypothetical protein
MDEADNANAQAEHWERVNRYKSRKPEIQAVACGECLFCGEPLGDGMRWCDAECRDLYEKENER